MNTGGRLPAGKPRGKTSPSDRILPGGTYFFIPSSSFTPYLSFWNG
jgi:hypothetical protein